MVLFAKMPSVVHEWLLVPVGGELRRLAMMGVFLCHPTAGVLRVRCNTSRIHLRICQFANSTQVRQELASWQCQYAIELLLYDANAVGLLNLSQVASCFEHHSIHAHSTMYDLKSSSSTNAGRQFLMSSVLEFLRLSDSAAH